MGQTTEGVVLWEEFTWPDLAERLEEMKMVLWWFGTTEQHGPHLPLSVDTIDVMEVASRVSQKTGVFLIPPMTYGCSQMHGRAFPGTLSLRPQTLIKCIEDICEWALQLGHPQDLSAQRSLRELRAASMRRLQRPVRPAARPPDQVLQLVG